MQNRKNELELKNLEKPSKELKGYSGQMRTELVIHSENT